ncbi:MAG: FtsX-like permease family protein [bacterium]|nr:FtsX-like permease family protein [bacterium]
MKEKSTKLPVFAARLLGYLTAYNKEFDALDMIEELYQEKYDSEGRLKVGLWLWKQVLLSTPEYLSLIFSRSFAMFKNYLKIALRSIKRQKGYSIINISGLAIGIACSIFATLYIIDELSYDKFHKNSENIYRVVTNAAVKGLPISDVNTSFTLGEKLRNDYPEIELLTMLTEEYYTIMEVNNLKYNKDKVIYADTYIFDVFSFKLIKGDPETALSQPNTAIVTETAAKKYFGDDDAYGQTAVIDGNVYTITGVLSDIPPNSHIHFDVALSMITIADKYRSYGWLSKTIKNYFILQESSSVSQMEGKLDQLIDEFILPSWEGEYDYVIQPLTQIHLHSHVTWNEFEENGRIEYIYILSISALFILLIACVNFINLSTAKSVNRALEVGIRKIVGSRRIQLIRQFVGESIIISLLALILGLIILEVLLISSGNILGKQLDINYFDNYYVLPAVICLAILTGLLSGVYPALFISSVKPVSALKSRYKYFSNNRKVNLRNGLVVFQFTISILFVISTIVIYSQLEYFTNKDLGFDKEQVLVIKNARLLKEKYNVYKENIRKYPDIESVSSSYAFPGTGSISWKFEPDGIEGTRMITYISDHNLVNTLDLTMAEGRFFSQDHPADQLAVVINEKTAKQFGWSDPIGKIMKNGDKDLSVIGVVKDFHYESLHNKVDMMAILLHAQYYPENNPTYIGIRINSVDVAGTVNTIKANWEEATSGMPLDLSFLDDDYEKFYQSEQKMGEITVICSLISIFIACLGLFGLMAFIVEQRTKEIGVRKVLGSSVSRLLCLITNDFIILLLIANVFAWPPAYYFMNLWLQRFAYRIDMDVSIFFAGGIIALVIAIFTISHLVITAARKNPVESLKYE